MKKICIEPSETRSIFCGQDLSAEAVVPDEQRGIVAVGERHLVRSLREFVAYYNEVRPHSNLDGNSPVPRRVDARGGQVVASRPFEFHNQHDSIECVQQIGLPDP